MTAPFLSGKFIFLRGLQKEDLNGNMRYWTDDREVTRFLFRGAFPANLEQLERDYDSQIHSDKEIEFAVIENESDSHIGVSGLHSINWVARSAECRTFIGEKAAWGKGYGTETTQLVVAYGFEILNLHRIWLGVNAEHHAAVRTYEKVGFVKEGETRDVIFRNGRYYNAMIMGVLKNEYERLRLKWNLADEIQKQFPR